jgi:hypothetical protein
MAKGGGASKRLAMGKAHVPMTKSAIEAAQSGFA